MQIMKFIGVETNKNIKIGQFLSFIEIHFSVEIDSAIERHEYRMANGS